VAFAIDWHVSSRNYGGIVIKLVSLLLTTRTLVAHSNLINKILQKTLTVLYTREIIKYTKTT